MAVSFMALKIVPPRSTASVDLVKGIMKFQFEPESVKESNKMKLKYNDTYLEDDKVPTYDGREPREVTMTLIMLDRGLARAKPVIVQTDLSFLKNEDDIIKKVIEAKRERDNVRGQLLPTAFDRVLLQDAARKQGLTNNDGSLNIVQAFEQGVFRKPGAQARGRAGDRRKRINLFPPPVKLPPSFSGDDAAVIGQPLGQFGSSSSSGIQIEGINVERQLNWLRTMQRSFPEFGNQPPTLRLMGMFKDEFTCMLESVDVIHLATNPETRDTLHAKVDIVLKERAVTKVTKTRKKRKGR